MEAERHSHLPRALHPVATSVSDAITDWFDLFTLAESTVGLRYLLVGQFLQARLQLCFLNVIILQSELPLFSNDNVCYNYHSCLHYSDVNSCDLLFSQWSRETWSYELDVWMCHLKWQPNLPTLRDFLCNHGLVLFCKQELVFLDAQSSRGAGWKFTREPRPLETEE